MRFVITTYDENGPILQGAGFRWTIEAEDADTACRMARYQLEAAGDFHPTKVVALDQDDPRNSAELELR